MFQKIGGALLLVLLFYVLYKLLTNRYRSHWKPWVGVGWMLMYDHETALVTVRTFLLKSPAGRAEIKRGSILLARNGETIPVFGVKEEFVTWLKSLKPEVGKAVTYTLREPLQNGEQPVRAVTLSHEVLRGDIPTYVPLPTYEHMHQDWKRLMPYFRAEYPKFRCPRTGVIYHRVKIIPCDFP